VKIIGVEELGADVERGRLPAPRLIAVCGGWKLWLTREEAMTMRANHTVDPPFVESVTIPRRGFVENADGKPGSEQYIESITAGDPYWDLVDENGEVAVRWDDPVIAGGKRYPDDPYTDAIFYRRKKDGAKGIRALIQALREGK
jgi:hypothetical protein